MKGFKVKIPVTTGENCSIDNSTQLSWIIRGFFIGICEAYEKYAPRREEARRIVNGMIKSAAKYGSISDSDAAELYEQVKSIENMTFPRSK